MTCRQWDQAFSRQFKDAHPNTARSQRASTPWQDSAHNTSDSCLWVMCNTPPSGCWQRRTSSTRAAQCMPGDHVVTSSVRVRRSAMSARVHCEGIWCFTGRPFPLLADGHSRAATKPAPWCGSAKPKRRGLRCGLAKHLDADEACSLVMSITSAGERAKAEARLLQGQAVPEAPDAQGHPVQDWQGFVVCARCCHLCWNQSALFILLVDPSTQHIHADCLQGRMPGIMLHCHESHLRWQAVAALCLVFNAHTVLHCGLYRTLHLHMLAVAD